MNFQALFSPEGVAVFGSVAPGKLGNVLLNRLVEGGTKKVFAVNPKAQGVGDIPGFVSAQEIEEPVDLGIIVSPAATVCSVMEDCGKAGIKAVVIITSGFAETGNLEGEAQIKEIADRYGIGFIGPNCAGLLNMHHGLVATLEATPPKGNIALVSQSGSIGGIMMSWAAEEGLGISKFVSYGNANGLNEMDFLRFLQDDPETDVIALYLENIKNGRTFMEVLRQTTKKKPVVIVKSGRTASGQRATLSHTGSMAGADGVYDAALKECGAIRAVDIEELLDICKGFAMLPSIQGNRLLVLTNSGGPAIMSVDAGEEMELVVEEPAENVKEALRQFLRPHASLRNPLDLTVEGTPEEYYETTVTALRDYDAALAIYVGTPYLASMPYAKNLVKAAKASGKPVLSMFTVGFDIEEGKDSLKQGGVPIYRTGERAVRTLGALWQYRQYLDRREEAVAAEDPAGLLDMPVVPEPMAMTILHDHGIPIPEMAMTCKATEAAALCRKIGYPVAMKVVSPDIIHKSDCGGVCLNIQTDQEALAAYEKMEQICRGKRFSGVVIYPMLEKGVEVLLGLTRDVQFGPVVVCGLGGIYSEVLKDISLRVAPVSKAAALNMIKSLRCYPILAGSRGKTPMDVEALAETIANFSQLPFLYPDLMEADLNPVMVYPEGVVTADVRILGRK